MIVIQMRRVKVLFFMFFLVFTGCSSNRWKVDVSAIKDEIKVDRFDKELFELDTSRLIPEMMKLESKYPDVFNIYEHNLYPHYFRRMKDKDSIYHTWKHYFIDNKYMHEVYNDAKKIYTDKETERLNEEFTDAAKHYKYYFPKDTLPKVSTVISSFGYKCFTTDQKRICVCLDMFLGENYKYYSAQNIDLPGYISRRLKKEYITPEALKAWFSYKYDEHDYTDKTIISQMIYAGKTLFFLDIMMPELNDTMKIEYTRQQMKWCEDFEKDVWKHFTGKEVLFKTEMSKQNEYMNEAPFTNAEGMPQESAPRLGEWVGWQLLKSYMDKNRDVTPKQLFEEKDYKKILQRSGYKP